FRPICAYPRSSAAKTTQALAPGMKRRFQHASRLTIFHEPERHPIHAIPQARGPGAIVEHMPEVAIALGAGHLCARHAEAPVLRLNPILFLDWRPEARPAGA